MIASETNIPSPLQVNLQSRVVSRTRGFFWLPLVSILALCFAIITTTAGEVSSTNSLTPYKMRRVKVEAELGGAMAQFIFGKCYLDGDGLAKDPVEAVKWLRKSAEQGFVDAQALLGWCLYTGKVVNPDPVESVKWIRKAAEQGYGKSQTVLAYRLLQGVGVTKDTVEAVKWLRKAAEQGETEAQLKLGVLLSERKELPRDDAEAYMWLRLAWENGNRDARRLALEFDQRIRAEDTEKGTKMAQEFRESMGKSQKPKSAP